VIIETSNNPDSPIDLDASAEDLKKADSDPALAQKYSQMSIDDKIDADRPAPSTPEKEEEKVVLVGEPVQSKDNTAKESTPAPSVSKEEITATLSPAVSGIFNLAKPISPPSKRQKRKSGPPPRKHDPEA
jgi:hypothetical protein